MVRGLEFLPANNNGRILKVFGLRVACDDVTIRMKASTAAGPFCIVPF
jgi:phosphoribosyl-AMP cyclohydrolase